MKGLGILIFWLFGLSVLGNVSIPGYEKFSSNARQWADSIYYTLDLELKVAQILVSNQSEFLADFKKQIPQPGFIIGNTDYSSSGMQKPGFALSTFIVPELKNISGQNDHTISFPDESSMILMGKEHQKQLKYLLANKLYSNGNPVFVASGKYSPLWMDGEVIGYENYSSRDILWMPGSHGNETGGKPGIRLFQMPRQVISLIPSRLPDISFKDTAHKTPVMSSGSWRREPVTEIAIEQVLNDGMLLLTDDYEYDYRRLLAAFKDRWLPESLLSKICKIALAFKYDAINNLVNYDSVFSVEEEELILRHAYENAIMLFQRQHRSPFPIQELNIRVGFYDNTKGNAEYFRAMAQNHVASPLDLADDVNYDFIFWLIDSFEDVKVDVNGFISHLKRTYDGTRVVMVYAGDLDEIPFARLPRHLDALIASPANIPYSWSSLAQVAFGGIATNKKDASYSFNDDLLELQRDIEASRLKYGTPLEAGLNKEMLFKTDKLIHDAIRQKATPGAQLLIIRNGIVAWHKSYGFHTYENFQPVLNTDLYDLASITKMSATLPALMKLYDEGRWRLADSLKSYLPESDTTDKRAITMRQLLLHESGLPAFIPFHISTLDRTKLIGDLYSRRRSATHPFQVDERLWMNRTAVLRDDLYRSVSDLRFSIPVARDLYLDGTYADSIYNQTILAHLNSNSYRYSDLNFLLLQRITENLTGHSLDQYVSKNFYGPMGASSLTYNPWKIMAVENVVPTENDVAFRRQLLRGYVHDQAAALMGGVAGHAGLFGNANDLGKMMQMYLNNGVYGYRRYLNSETIKFFSARQNQYSRRGLGFDKPEPDPAKVSPAGKLASPQSFGHSGFSGTIAWADPEYNLVYVFLSNRIHPNQYNRILIQENIRTKLQDIIYESILDK
ncbi:serine hydrolase domain-containing protein [Natronoflexus pectinivorans]|uniref:CubicO group peptidase (Beta-lactamase class C family) n=1 Tax=Natronoflexus pectinivorans TaxID=682526 RepID=A0A4R2GKF7_9BACT|nr:serine hydrolase [Natronoflexus pectinivorans]TCO09262.1 CubicO group peptidase (beta-lactamase class C family) [Natronoflexus pectinivorans]